MGLIARVKTWIAGETLKAADVNAEFNNVLNNLTPAKLDDYSSTINQMREVLDPGDENSEVQATNLSEEIKELRSMIRKIVGGSQWYTPPGATITGLNTSIGQNLPLNRIISGLVDANRQPSFLRTSTTKAVLKGATTSFSFAVNNTQVDVSDDASDVTPTAGYSSNHTATYLDADHTGEETKYLGEEEGTKIILGSVGSTISSSAGKLCAFKTTNGADTEYFVGHVRYDGTNYFIEGCLRGYLFDSSFVAKRVVLAPSQVITLLRLSYIFINSSSQLKFNESNNEPIFSGTQPATPSTNDIWYDIVNEKFKIYNGSAFIDHNSVLIGFSAQSNTACEATRPLDFYENRSPLCSFTLRKISDTEIGAFKFGGSLNVNGIIPTFQSALIKFDTDLDMDTGTIAISEKYFLYMTDHFEPKISLIAPHDRQEDLFGMYRIDRPWRCLGYFYTDSSANVSHIQVFGSSPYLSDHSVGIEKLRPYVYDGENLRNSVRHVAISETLSSSTGEETFTNKVTIRSSGRPVFIFMNEDTPSGIKEIVGRVTPTEYLSLIIYRRRIGETSRTKIYDNLFKENTSTGIYIDIPKSVVGAIDFPGVGEFEYSLSVFNTGIDTSVNAGFNAIEL